MKHKTLKGSISFEGVGLHTGNQCKVTISPNTESTGIVFKDLDHEGSTDKLSLRKVNSTNRSTNISVGEGLVHTVEHLLSALSAHQVSQAIVEVSGGEIPILDGSSYAFYTSMEEVGIQELNEEQSALAIHHAFEYYDKETGATYTYKPSQSTTISCTLDFGGNAIGQQYAAISDWSQYGSQISRAKTFVLVQDLDKLLKAGLIKGGSFDSALIYAKNEYKKEELASLAKRFDVDISRLSEGPVLNASIQTYRNEPARHKLLDVIGDLYLIGKQIHGIITADRPSHTANVNFAKHLLQVYKDEQKTGVIPVCDPNQPPLHDHEAIKKLLPHRFPFLLVDQVYECTEKCVVAVKNVSGDQYFFPGHFPGNPVFPGVLQMEALAQTGGILALSSVPDPENYDTYFLKMDAVKFKNLVRPGDRLILKMELLSPIRRGIVHMKGTAYVGRTVVSEGELTARIQKRTA